MPESFLFYDLETFGADPRRSRIAQFAAIRTDLDLNPVEEPICFFVQPADDLLPSPGASLVTGITPQQALRDGINEAAAFAPRFGDTVRPGMEQQRPRRGEAVGSAGPRLPRQPSGQLPCRLRAGGFFAAKARQPPFEIDRVAAEAAFGQHHREIGGRKRQAVFGGPCQHMREPRRQCQLAHAFALAGQPAVRVDGAERNEQGPRFGKGCGRQRVEEGKRRRIGDPEGGAVENEAGKIGLEDFGRREGR